MKQQIREKIREYKKKFIKKSEYIVEVGSCDSEGGVKHLFEDADDFCGIDNHRGPGVDMVSPLFEVNKLFDFNPDTVIYLKNNKNDKYINKTIKAVRDLIIPGGYLIICIPNTVEGSYADVLFGGYKILDLTEVESTICGIAQKPYTIRYDIKKHS